MKNRLESVPVQFVKVKMEVLGTDDALECFKNVDWCAEVFGSGMGMLAYIPEIQALDWEELEITESDHSLEYYWKSVRPFDFLHRFAKQLNKLTFIVSFVHEQDSYIGVTVYDSGEEYSCFDDFVDCNIPVYLSDGQTIDDLEEERERYRCQILHQLREKAIKKAGIKL